MAWWEGPEVFFASDPWKGVARGHAQGAQSSSPPTSTAAAVDPGKPLPFYITFYTQNQPRQVTAMLGDTPPTPSGGGGGYEVVPLPGRAPIVVWRRQDLVVMPVPIVFDNFTDGHSAPVKDAVDTLWGMWAGDTPGQPPPPVQIKATGWAVPFRRVTSWFISDLTWGDAEANEHGNRVRQALVVELTAYNPETRLGVEFYPVSVPKKRAAKSHKKHGTKPKAKRKVRVAQGETLSMVALRLGLAGGWPALGLAQSPPITDPRAVTVGQELRLPAGVLLADDET